jgi:hypothetical protein
VRPPRRHRLIAVDQVLVDERRPELVGFDGAGDGLDGCHGGGRSLRTVPRSWMITMTILVCCLLASMAIALVKLL